jgi:hypothetical protein
LVLIAGTSGDGPRDGDLAGLASLFRRGPSGARSCVPVFGTGLNIQAAAGEGLRRWDDWADLLAKIGARIGITGNDLTRLPRGHLALWEALLRAWAGHMGVYPYQAEAQLQTFVCDELREQEKECAGFRLYRDIAMAGFADIISLNFDRRIAMGSKSNKFCVGANSLRYGSQGESLFRHSTVLQSNRMTTRIWYPHGDVKKANTVKLGVRKYGFYIGTFREHLHHLDNSWRYKPNSKQVKTETGEVKTPADAATWLDLMLQRPLVFVGCGLSADEWPLWWVLRERGGRGSNAAPTYWLAIQDKKMGSTPPHFSLLPSLRVVSFGSPEQLWDVLSSWISG